MSWTFILKSLLPVCFFSVFAVSSVESYTCANSECINEMCAPILDVCETSQACFSQVQELLAPARSSNITAQQKGCSTDVCTDLAFSATLGNEQTFKFDHRCCQTEQCNQGDLHPSPPPSEPNGVQCLACYAEAGGLCIPTPLKCTGAETKCVLAFGSEDELLELLPSLPECWDDRCMPLCPVYLSRTRPSSMLHGRALCQQSSIPSTNFLSLHQLMAAADQE